MSYPKREEQRDPPKPSATHSWLGILAPIGGLGAAAAAAIKAAPVSDIPVWFWAAVLLLALVALLGGGTVAVLRTCWPSQSAHRRDLLELLLHRAARRRSQR